MSTIGSALSKGSDECFPASALLFCNKDGFRNIGADLHPKLFNL